MSAPVARAAADLRLLRAAVFTAVCVALSAAGHMMGSCTTVPLWALAAACVAVFAVVAALAGRERTLPGIAVALAAGQVGLHVLFGWAQMRAGTGMVMDTDRAASSSPSASSLSGRDAAALAHQLVCGLDGRALTPGQARTTVVDSRLDPHALSDLLGQGTTASGAAHGLLPSAPMLLGHLLAALAVGWLLRRGEAALWRLVRLSGAAARALAAWAPLAAAWRAWLLLCALCAATTGAGAGPRRPVRRDEQASTTRWYLTHSLVRRGPPALALAA
ncbi:hypothetical protein ACFV3R_01395 [Streptomyces sp. NPDC059740]|uniref:hypothetical protein n=1 Tax=Streptomyces sp. NPDC059740 TaxID=3346926 RepID=UPI0036613CC1